MFAVGLATSSAAPLGTPSILPDSWRNILLRYISRNAGIVLFRHALAGVASVANLIVTQAGRPVKGGA